MIQQTSLEAYTSILPRLSERQAKVFAVIEESDRPVCDVEIGAALHWTINCVTPRRGELELLQLVRKAGSTTTTSGRRTHTYTAIQRRLR